MVGGTFGHTSIGVFIKKACGFLGMERRNIKSVKEAMLVTLQ